MVDFRGKGNLRRLERVVSREVYVKEENTTLKRAVTGTHDSCLGKKSENKQLHVDMEPFLVPANGIGYHQQVLQNTEQVGHVLGPATPCLSSSGPW